MLNDFVEQNESFILLKWPCQAGQGNLHFMPLRLVTAFIAVPLEMFGRQELLQIVESMEAACDRTLWISQRLEEKAAVRITLIDEFQILEDRFEGRYLDQNDTEFFRITIHALDAQFAYGRDPIRKLDHSNEARCKSKSFRHSSKNC